MRVTSAVGGDRFVCAGSAVCRQNCAVNRVQLSRLAPARSTRANCSSGAQDTANELDPLDRPATGEPGIRLPNQAQSVVEGNEQQLVTVLERDEKKEGGEIDYLQVCLCACLCELRAVLRLRLARWAHSMPRSMDRCWACKSVPKYAVEQQILHIAVMPLQCSNAYAM